jgi:hypothetical protein
VLPYRSLLECLHQSGAGEAKKSRARRRGHIQSGFQTI